MQTKLLAIMVKCTAVPSILGSSYIAYEVLKNKRKRGKTYHRLLLAMSISDIMSSTAIFVGSWAIPKGTDGICKLGYIPFLLLNSSFRAFTRFDSYTNALFSNICFDIF